MILHIHKELTDSLSLLGCANEFIYNENLRKNFGKFSAKDLLVHNDKKFNKETQTNDVLPVFDYSSLNRYNFETRRDIKKR